MKAGSAKSTVKQAATKVAVKKAAKKPADTKSAASKPAASKPAKASAAKPRAEHAASTKATATRAARLKTTTSVTKAAKAAAKPKAAVARTRKATAPVLVEQASAGSATLDLILAKIDDMKAEQTVTIDLRGKSAFSDFMVVTSGRSNRHVGAVAETISKGLKEQGIKGLHVEGLTNCDWVLIDTGEVIVHIFRPEVREFYNLERLWTQTPDAIAKPA